MTPMEQAIAEFGATPWLPRDEVDRWARRRKTPLAPYPERVEHAYARHGALLRERAEEIAECRAWAEDNAVKHLIDETLNRVPFRKRPAEIKIIPQVDVWHGELRLHLAGRPVALPRSQALELLNKNAAVPYCPMVA